MTNWKDRGFVNHDFINMTKKKNCKKNKSSQKHGLHNYLAICKGPPFPEEIQNITTYVSVSMFSMFQTR